MLRGSLILSQQQLWKEGSFLVFSPAQKRPPLQWSMKGMLKNNEQEKHGGNPKRVWFVFVKRFFPLQNYKTLVVEDAQMCEAPLFFPCSRDALLKMQSQNPFKD